MRLIDADEFDKCLKNGEIEASRGRKNVVAGIINTVRGNLANAPTVDPIKHGHWTDRAKSIIGVPTEACSECAEWSIGFDKDYCPCCGAKMDEVTDG